MRNTKKIASLLLSAAIASSMMVPAFALEYDFAADQPGQSFYQATRSEERRVGKEC